MRVKYGKYQPLHEMISIGPKCWRGYDSVLHEFAHHLFKARGFKCYSETKKLGHHDDKFYSCLKEVVAAWGQPYSWDTEYEHIQTWHERGR